jgi:hypothetical protein
MVLFPAVITITTAFPENREQNENLENQLRLGVKSFGFSFN